MPGVESQGKPEQHFPDSAYRERLGYHTYDEALVYRGAAEQVRIEFKVPKIIPVPWWSVRRAIEAQLRFQGRHPLRIGLWKGPEIEGFGIVPGVAYKLELTAHGSPALLISVAAVLAALALVLGAGTVLVFAIQGKSVIFEHIARGLGETPGALKWAAAAVIIIALARTIPKYLPKPS